MTNYEEAPKNVGKNAIQFAVACIDDCTIGDLENVSRVDKTDCESWDITPEEWKWAIGAALYAKQNGGSMMDDGRVVV